MSPSPTPLEIGSEALLPAEFIYHQAPTPFGSYLALNLDFKPYNELRTALEKRIDTHLQHRGEAHITVITPIEFDQVLSRKISIDKIQSIAIKANLQKAQWSLVCVGQGQAQVNGKKESTYFVVVESLDLIEIRKKIHSAFIQAGGNPKNFDPQLYFPHVTLGFTARDLHYEDGVLKNTQACIHPLKVIQK